MAPCSHPSIAARLQPLNRERSNPSLRFRRSVVVELTSDGVVGYGEAAPFEFPFYSSETTGSVLALYRDLLVERVEGKTFGSVAEFNAELKRGVRGNARAPLLRPRRCAPATRRSRVPAPRCDLPYTVYYGVKNVGYYDPQMETIARM